MQEINLGAFSRDFSSLRHTASASTSALHLQDLCIRGFATIFGDFTNIASAKTTSFEEGLCQTALQEDLRQNNDDSPPPTRRHEGASPTPLVSTLALPPPNTFYRKAFANIFSESQ
jgi:hypothetical protein